MKKIISILLIIGLLFYNVKIVKGVDVTFSEVASKFKEPYTGDLNGAEAMFQAIEKNTTITSDDTKIVATYKANDLTRIVTFNHNNGLISYEYIGNKNDSTVASNAMIDSLLIGKLLFVIAELKGYNINDLANVNFDENNFTLAEHGIEVTSFKYNVSLDSENSSGSMSGEAYDTLLIDLNKFNLDSLIANNNTANDKNKVDDNTDNQTDDNTPTEPSDNTTDTENPDNPKTGYEDYLIPTSILLVIGIFLISKLKRKNYFKKI